MLRCLLIFTTPSQGDVRTGSRQRSSVVEIKLSANTNREENEK